MSVFIVAPEFEIRANPLNLRSGESDVTQECDKCPISTGHFGTFWDIAGTEGLGIRLIYANAKYKQHSAEGGPAHMRQFIANGVALGHQIWIWHGEKHPLSQPLPAGKLQRLKLLRSVDAIYYRVESKAPWGWRWILPPRRKIIGSPVIAWEFNTVPEYGLVQGDSQEAVQGAIAELRRLAAGVDLAVGVSKGICQYVREKLGISRVVEVPNGSDPELFRPDAPAVRRIVRKPGRVNVVWIGSAHLAWHNFDLLRGAAWEMWNGGQGERIVFHVIGPGMQQMRDCPPNLNYYGWEQYEQLPGWLSAMDVGLNVYRPGPADYSSPLKVFDYMASGLTVVSTDQPQAREIFQKLDQCDLLVPPDDPHALAQALRKLADDPQRRRKQGDAGRKLVIDYYNWRRATADIFAEIQKVLELRHSS